MTATAFVRTGPVPSPVPAEGGRAWWRSLDGWGGRLAAFGAGLLAAIGFLGDGFDVPKSVLAPCTLLGLAALWLLMTARPRKGPALAWWWGWGFYALGLIWIADAFYYQAKMPPQLGYVTVLGLAALLAVMPMLAALAAFRLVRAAPARPFVFAAAWMATEWVRLWLFTGFPWNPLAAVTLFQFSPGGARVAAWIGAMGLSGLIVLGAAGVAALWRRSLWLGLLIGTAAIPVFGFVADLVSTPPPPRARSVELVIVQPNIGQEVKWREDSLAFQVDALLRNSRSGPLPRAGVPRLILWPEVALPNVDLERDAAARAALARLLRPGDLLLTGGNALGYGADGWANFATNSLFVLDSSARILGRFDKFHLVPGGEYVPLRPVANALGLSRLAPGALDFTPGPGPRTLPLPGLPAFGPLICYEIIFPGEIVDEAHRPQWIFNPSNDAWFGRLGPPQALAIARLRAIEEGLPVARSTPTGITALIGGDGTLLAALHQYAEGAIVTDLPPTPAPTLFSRFGHFTSLAVGLALLGAGALAARRRQT